MYVYDIYIYIYILVYIYICMIIYICAIICAWFTNEAQAKLS